LIHIYVLFVHIHTVLTNYLINFIELMQETIIFLQFILSKFGHTLNLGKHGNFTNDDDDFDDNDETTTITIITNNSPEEYQLLGYNAVYSVVCQPTFRTNISPPSSGSKK
jgi:hypothetical protein